MKPGHSFSGNIETNMGWARPEIWPEQWIDNLAIRCFAIGDYINVVKLPIGLNFEKVSKVSNGCRAYTQVPKGGNALLLKLNPPILPT